MGSISRLDAVNQMLLAAGESLVADLENESGVDTKLSEFILDQTAQDHQLRGLASNKYVKKYNLETAGDIILPENTLSGELISNHVDTDGNIQVGIDRQKKIFNITDNTYSWKASTDYYIEIIFELSWDDLPTPAQRGILASAMRQYQLIVQGDDVTDRYLADLEAIHKSRSKASDINDARVSIFSSGSTVMNQALSRLNSSAYDPNRHRYWRHKGL